jgi:hypothetical protein
LVKTARREQLNVTIEGKTGLILPPLFRGFALTLPLVVWTNPPTDFL